MKYLDHVKQCIVRYPSLYKCDTFEQSEILVAHHTFITLGNGYEWAINAEGGCEGYLTEPKMKRIRGEWERQPDSPYGKHKVNARLFNRTMTENIYWYPTEYSGSLDGYPDFNSYVYIFESDLTDEIRDDPLFKNFARIVKTSRFGQPFSLYPNFKKTYSRFWEPEAKYIREDWRIAAIKHLNFCRSVLTTPGYPHGDPYYDSYFDGGAIIKPRIDAHIVKTGCSEHEAYAAWGVNDADNFDDFMAKRWWYYFNGCLSFIDETIESLGNIHR